MTARTIHGTILYLLHSPLCCAAKQVFVFRVVVTVELSLTVTLVEGFTLRGEPLWHRLWCMLIYSGKCLKQRWYETFPGYFIKLYNLLFYSAVTCCRVYAGRQTQTVLVDWTVFYSRGSFIRSWASLWCNNSADLSVAASEASTEDPKAAWLDLTLLYEPIKVWLCTLSRFSHSNR